MSIVGPRPERPEIAAEYEKEMPEFRLRLQARAGLTGYAQVYGKYNTTPYDKLQMDLTIIQSKLVVLYPYKDTENARLGKPLEFDREEFLKQLQELKKEAYQDGEHIRESVRAIVSTYRYQ